MCSTGFPSTRSGFCSPMDETRKLAGDLSSAGSESLFLEGITRLLRCHLSLILLFKKQLVRKIGSEKAKNEAATIPFPPIDCFGRMFRQSGTSFFFSRKIIDVFFRSKRQRPHRARNTLEWLHDEGVSVLSWPPYSPDLNPH